MQFRLINTGLHRSSSYVLLHFVLTGVFFEVADIQHRFSSARICLGQSRGHPRHPIEAVRLRYERFSLGLSVLFPTPTQFRVDSGPGVSCHPRRPPTIFSLSPDRCVFFLFIYYFLFIYLFIYLYFQYWVCVYGLRPFASLRIVNKVGSLLLLKKKKKKDRCVYVCSSQPVGQRRLWC